MAVKTAASQIAARLQNALLTRITADQFADQIETALHGVPAIHGNELAPPLQTMAEVALVLRHLGVDEEVLQPLVLPTHAQGLHAIARTSPAQQGAGAHGLQVQDGPPRVALPGAFTQAPVPADSLETPVLPLGGPGEGQRQRRAFRLERRNPERPRAPRRKAEAAVAGGMPAVPHARNDDGVLNLLLAGAFGRAGTLWVLPLLLAGRHLGHPKVRTRAFRKMVIASTEPVPLAADGEYLGESGFAFTHASVSYTHLTLPTSDLV